MLNDNDRALIARFASENPEAAHAIGLLEKDHRQMLSMLAHEVRNPLTLIHSSLQLIEKAHPEAKDFRFWSQIKEDIHSIQRLLDDLSFYNNAAVLHLENFDLYQLTESVTEAFRPELDKRDIRLTLSSQCQLPEIKGDTFKLRQVLVNLMKNAIEALDGVKEPVITIDFRATSSAVLISVSDNGCGISQEQAQEIFLPFKTFKSQGTGLGLPLCRQIILAHGGDLNFESEVNEGATFWVTLPSFVI